jgi:hypothetical protein
MLFDKRIHAHLKKKVLSLSTCLRNRTTVELEIHMPVPSHRDGTARLRTEVLRADATRLQITEVLKVRSRLHRFAAL